jgi:hypothetical protein
LLQCFGVALKCHQFIIGIGVRDHLSHCLSVS